MTEEAKAGMYCSRYAHFGLAWKGEKGLWNHFYLGIAIDERPQSLGAPRPVALRSAGMKAATEYCQMERWE